MATRPTEVTQSPETGDTVEECTGKQLFSECIADLEDLFSSVSQSCSDLFCSVVFFWSFFCSVKKKSVCLCQLSVLWKRCFSVQYWSDISCWKAFLLILTWILKAGCWSLKG